MEQKSIAKDDRRTRIAYIVEAGFEHFISLFVSGALLVYVLEALGINDALKGIISGFTTFACSAQLVAIFLSGKQVKCIVTIGHILNQLCFVLLYLLPIFEIPQAVKVAVFVILLCLGHLLNNAINPSKITMFMASVPDSKRGSFTATKEMISLAGGIGISILFGWFADTFCTADGSPSSTYYIICCCALFLMMAIHTATILIAREKPAERKKVAFSKTLRMMVTNKNLLKVIVVGMLWNIASSLSVSFFSSYLQKELAFSMTLITIMTSIGSVCRIAVSPLVGRIADKKSFSYSMTLCFAIAAAAFSFNIFAAPGPARWLHLVYICLQAFAMAGINSGVINLIYDYVDPEDRSAALGIKNAIGGILAFLAALIGGAILDGIQALPGGTLRIFNVPVYAQQVLSVLSLTVIIILIIYMRVVIAPMKRVKKNDE